MTRQGEKCQPPGEGGLCFAAKQGHGTGQTPPPISSSEALHNPREREREREVFTGPCLEMRTPSPMSLHAEPAATVLSALLAGGAQGSLWTGVRAVCVVCVIFCLVLELKRSLMLGRNTAVLAPPVHTCCPPAGSRRPAEPTEPSTLLRLSWLPWP